MLRGEDQKLRRQMVTRELFLAYEVGDRFDEHASPAAVARRRIAGTPKPNSSPNIEPLGRISETKPRSDIRLASSNLPREMLPETEGF